MLMCGNNPAKKEVDRSLWYNALYRGDGEKVSEPGLPQGEVVTWSTVSIRAEL